MARQKGARKRSLQVVHEHFETLFNAAGAALGIKQSFPRLEHRIIDLDIRLRAKFF